MEHPGKSKRAIQLNKLITTDRFLLATSILLQLVLALFFGHAYDTRIFMATGNLVGTGQNPYLAQDLSTVFHNSTFQGITTFGYPPPWAIILGLIYFCTYNILPSFLFYNLAIKIPIITANLLLAYFVVFLLKKNGAQERTVRRAWLFMLFNPFLLLTSSAWGQFDSVVTLLSLVSLYLISEGRLKLPAILLALAISLKPIALPLILIIFVYLIRRSLRLTIQFLFIFSLSMLVFCITPFLIFRWDPSPILQNWNFHFSVGGGLSYMTFLEYTKWTYQLPGQWWFLGWVWVPALGIAAYALKPGINSLADLLKKSVALILVFFLCRTWLAETNLNLILPMVVFLTSIGELKRISLWLVWCLPLMFSFFNTSLAQLFFPSMPGLMDRLLNLAGQYNQLRYHLRTAIVILWIIAGWWIVYQCFKRIPAKSLKFPPLKRIPSGKED